MAQTLKFGNKVWAAKEESVLAYNDINNNYKPLPFTFKRTSIGTRVNKDGLIETMGQDIARIDYTDSADGVLLLEPSSTNLINYSQAISNSSPKSGTFVDNFAISPDGTQNATKLTATSTDPHFYQSIAVSSGDYTISVYVKGIGSTIGKEFLLVLGSGVTSTIQTITGQWKRFTFSGALSAGTSIRGIEIPNPAVTGDEVLVWGFQVEQSSYPTSYIPTSGSSVTRAVDTCNNSGNSEVFNDSEGVLFANIAALADDGTTRAISINDESTDNFVQFAFRPSTNTIRYRLESGNLLQFSNEELVTDTTIFNKCALKYKVNDFAFWVNGFKIAVITNGITPTGLNKLSFDNGIGSSDFYGKTKELGYYDTALTDAELETLTSYRNWVSMVNELNLNIIYNG